jgi:hypothetical protein
MSEGKGRQVNIGRASTMVSCLPFLSLGIQVVREAKAADVLETQRHEAQSASANGVGLPPLPSHPPRGGRTRFACRIFRKGRGAT